MYFLKISFAPGMYLNLDVVTFRKNVYSQNGCFYLIDSNTGYLRRKLKDDDVNQEDLFTESSFEGTHNTVKFLDFHSYDSFRKCKLGIMEQFLQDVHSYLGKYITLKPMMREGDTVYEDFKNEKESLAGERYGEILDELGVNIVDTCHTEESSLIVRRLVSELEKYYGITPKIGNLQANMYNIRIIHSSEYYQEHNEPDPHANDLSGYIVQHLTQEAQCELLEEIGVKQSPVVKKILTELIIKGDVWSRQIRIYNWKNLCADKTWTFVQRRKLKKPEGGFAWIDNSAGHKTGDRYQYSTVEISPDGQMEFHNFDDLKPSSNEWEERIRFTFDNYADTQRRVGKEVEGLVFSNIENIQVIIRTKEKTMPNTSAIWNALKETDKKDAIIRDVILEALHEYRTIQEDATVYVDGLIAELSNRPATITKGELRKLMKVGSKAGKNFNRFLHQEYGIWVSPEMKDSKFADDYCLENMLDIKYRIDSDTDGTGEVSFNYYVGRRRKDLNLSIHNACIIRQVLAEEELEFEELLPLMAVDFVRIGDYTVLPFPFKYLREWELSH